MFQRLQLAYFIARIILPIVIYSHNDICFAFVQQQHHQQSTLPCSFFTYKAGKVDHHARITSIFATDPTSTDSTTVTKEDTIVSTTPTIVDTQKVLPEKQVGLLGNLELLQTEARDLIEQSDNQTLAQRPPRTNLNTGSFDLTTALFAGGLAFDAYVEPAPNSSRWERGSRDCNVAFVSTAFTRNVYKGLVEVTLDRITDLPKSSDQQGVAESLLTGSGIDACLLVAAVEGRWQEDLDYLDREQHHAGVLDLSGAAHVGRTSTAWSSTDKLTSERLRKQRKGKAAPYCEEKSAFFTSSVSAVWPDPEPFYLYVQDPASVQLVLTVVDRDRLSFGQAVGTTVKKLVDLVPEAAWSAQQWMADLKRSIVQQIQQQAVNGDGNVNIEEIMNGVDSNFQLEGKEWKGVIPLTKKPKKRDKNGQILAGAAAGAYIAGPVGAAAGALVGGFYEGQAQGKVHLKIKYLPLLPGPMERPKYRVLGGMPGIDWGTVLEKHYSKSTEKRTSPLPQINDLELCFFVNHGKTGATCTVYRSLEEKLIVVSFRGTCQPIDLLTDASIVQEAWVQGEDIREVATAKVHAGFRQSLQSIARRLKELLLATVAPGDDLSEYDMLVTGHSLGGALSTLFVADIAEFGIDAGRALPQLEESDPWWKSLAETFLGKSDKPERVEPPRPKSLKMYNFGSPRVGNEAFSERFDSLLKKGRIQQAYRIVNGEDVVARLPRTMNAFVLGQIGYEHCGTTVLISQPSEEQNSAPLVWIEGESDNNQCPVRDGFSLTSPTAEGSLLADLYKATRESFDSAEEDSDSPLSWSKLANAASKVTQRIQSLTAADVASMLGIDKKYTERELKMVQSIFQGRALAHHMENEYYAGMGRACGFLTVVGEEIVELEKVPEN